MNAAIITSLDTSVEVECGPAIFESDGFESIHEQAADTETLGVGMDEELVDFGAMARVLLGAPFELNGADDVASRGRPLGEAARSDCQDDCNDERGLSHAHGFCLR